MTLDSFRVLGLGATAFATALAGLVALIGSANASVQEAPSSGLPLAVAGASLLLAAVLMMASKRSDLVQLILGGLAAGSFGIVAEEISALAAVTPDHYQGLWIPMALGGLLIAFRAFGRPAAAAR